MLRTTRHLAHLFAFFFSPHDVLHTCQHEGMPLYRGEGYHMRMRTGQLPTKMDDTQDPHSPPYAHCIEDEPSSGGQTTKHHSTNKRHCTNVKIFI